MVNKMVHSQKIYDETVRPALQEKFGYKNVMQIPQVKKIVLNIGVGDAASDSKAIKAPVEELTLIAGQKAVITRAKKSIAGFKLREGQAIGCKVTLRGKRMYEFLDRLVNVAMPRIRDFRGVSPKSFDGRGNYAFGLKEQIIFPEINYDKVDKIRGMDVVINTSANTNEEAKELLAGLGFPFRK